MTVFVASLFLPYTIHFNVTKATSRPPLPSRRSSQIRAGDYNDGQPLSLFSQDMTISPIPETPAVTEHEGFFVPKQPSSIDAKISHKNAPHPMALSDPHSPAWGKSGFNQPRSRASRKSQRDQSHERAFNSVAWSVHSAEQGNGGLRNAVQAAVEAGSLEEKTWVGTLGMPTDALEDSQKFDIEDRLANEYDSLTVFLSDSDFDGHYSRYCKTILWPVFHYQIPDNPKSKAFEDHSWVYYVKANQAFTDRIVKDWKRGDIIWIHDYHLLLVPSMVRSKLPDAQIGFFLHVAFPSSEVFRCLAVRRELLEGLLGANLIGFQTQEYCHHFLQTCSRLLCVEATTDGLQLEDRFVNVSTFPIGIDPVSLSAKRADPEVLNHIDRIKDKYPDKKLIVARDKLDHVRGVRQKLLAFELFLNKYPHMSEKVVMIQVATSTTEQAELDATVSDIVTRINSVHSTLAHQPLVFLKQDIEFTQYLAMITAADALMITSLREGMNLTSHEFLFCQDGKYSVNKHGSLILSEFTGSASVFKENDLSVNPWDYRQCSEAIRSALEMGTQERDERWHKLMAAVMHHTAEYWFTSFLGRLKKAWKEHTRRDTISIPRLSISQLAEQYQSAERRLFILDYEGTLASSGSSSTTLLTSPQRTLDILNEILEDGKNVVYVMSEKKPEDLDSLFRRVPDLGLIAENGCFLKEFGSEDWAEMADIEKMMVWKQSVQGLLDYYRERIEGSWIEERHCSLVLHYHKADDQLAAAKQGGECANHLNDVCESQHVHAIPIEGGVLVEPTDFSKGTAATQIFELLKKKDVEDKRTKTPDFLMVAGDARDDEVIFRWANQLGKQNVIKDVTTVSVGSRNTEAMATLTQGVTGILSALHKLATLP